jgi:hypothetical protein
VTGTPPPADGLSTGPLAPRLWRHCIACRQFVPAEWRVYAWPSSWLSNGCDRQRLQTMKLCPRRGTMKFLRSNHNGKGSFVLTAPASCSGFYCRQLPVELPTYEFQVTSVRLDVESCRFYVSPCQLQLTADLRKTLACC